MSSEWRTNRLGEVCSFLNRGISPRYVESGGMCVLNQKCIRDHRVRFELSRRHDALAKAVSDERLIRAGDVLVNSTGTGTLGRLAQLREAPPEPATVDSHLTIVRPETGKFYPEFFGYMMLAIEDAIKKAGDGCGGQTELARSVLANSFLVSYPESLHEQQRIVGILDEAFEGIAIAKSSAEKNVENARALFHGHLQSVFNRRIKIWVERPLAEIAELISGQHIDAKDYNTESKGVAYLTGPSDFGVRNPVVTKWTEHPKRSARKNDILVTVKGSGVGKINLLNIPEVAISRQLMAVRSDQVDINYLYLFLSTKYEYFQSLSKGAAIPGISRDDLLELSCPMPPREEQRDISRLCDALSNQTERLASIYHQKLFALAQLRESLLDQAFAGQL